MALAHEVPGRTGQESSLRRCLSIRDALIRAGLFKNAGHEQDAGEPAVATRWCISPTPFPLSPDQVSFFQSFGAHLLAFYRALNQLYFDSVHGTQPAWVASYLDQGKPDSLTALSRMDRFRNLLPDVIRPDIIPTEAGMVVTELDSVPGGIGLTGALGQAYGQVASGKRKAEDLADSPASTSRLSPLAPRQFDIVGGADGMVRGFAAMLRHRLGNRFGCVAIVVSEESKDYRPEMAWLATQLREQGLDAWCVEPSEVRFTEEGLRLAGDGGERPIALIYRFFELFDLPNVPKSELILYSAQKGLALVTPPFKPALEEKLAFALFHHPVLRPFWQEHLGEDALTVLSGLIPRTWVLDPRPMPPSAVIPDLRLNGRAIADWRDLAHASQKGRRLVIKPSGFSPLAWGSRGVSVGHDLPQSEWAAALDHALASFPTKPSILQEFHKGRQFELSYYNEQTQEVVPMTGRVRLSPYYFVTGEKAELAGILATVCPLDKKLLHGMKDAIMIPCAVAPEAR